MQQASFQNENLHSQNLAVMLKDNLDQDSSYVLPKFENALIISAIRRGISDYQKH